MRFDRLAILFLAVFASFGSFLEVSGQTGTAAEFTRLDQSIESLEKKKKLPETAKEILADIRKDFSLLSGKWLASKRNELPKDYLLTLNLDAQTLENIAPGTDPVVLSNALELVRSDLLIKIASATRSANAAEDLGASITISVRTVKAGSDVPGYTVICNSQLHRDRMTSEFPFNNETPSKRTLPPGHYRIRIEKNGTAISFRDITIGDADPVDIVFTLP